MRCFSAERESCKVEEHILFDLQPAAEMKIMVFYKRTAVDFSPWRWLHGMGDNRMIGRKTINAITLKFKYIFSLNKYSIACASISH